MAVAIRPFSFDSSEALATVVGLLIDVPVMLLAVKVDNANRGWYQAEAG